MLLKSHSKLLGLVSAAAAIVLFAPVATSEAGNGAQDRSTP